MYIISIFLGIHEYRDNNMMHLCIETIYQTNFALHWNWPRLARSIHAPSIGTTGKRKRLGHENTVGAVSTSISAFDDVLDDECAMSRSVFVLQSHSFVSGVPFWTFLEQFMVLINQLSMAIDCFARFQQLIVHNSFLVPQNAQNCLLSEAIWSCRRCGCSARWKSRFFAYEILELNSLLIASNNSIEETLPSWRKSGSSI